MLDLQGFDPQKLTTNDIFTDEECNQIKSQRDLAQEGVAELDAELAFAECSLEADRPPASTRQQSITRRKRRGLVDFISACAIATAPQKYLPAELLAHIFALAFDGYSSSLPPVGRSMGPLALCHTCSRWRRVALDTPELWSNVVLCHARGQDTDKTLAIAQEWFSRSGVSTALSLETASAKDKEHFSPEELRAIFYQLVVPYAARFWNLKLLMLEAEICTLLTGSSLHFPLLRSIFLLRDPRYERRWEWHTSTSSDGNSNLLRTTHRLIKVKLHDFQHLWRDISPLFPWTSITHIALLDTPLSFLHGHALFRKCPRLVECQMGISTHAPLQDAGSLSATTQASESPIELPHLEVLNLTFNASVQYGDHVQRFFLPLCAPGLKELSMGCNTSPVCWPTSLVLSAVNGHPDLEALTISGISLDKQTISDTIHALPALVDLRLGLYSLLPWAVLEGLASGDLLPRLQTLVCRVDSLETAICMLERRWEGSLRPDAPLARPSYFMMEYVGGVITRDQALRVDHLRENGIKIELEHFESRKY